MTRGDKYTPITIKVGQLDYENNPSEKVKIVGGMKVAFLSLKMK
jgi:hypothetical protein